MKKSESIENALELPALLHPGCAHIDLAGNREAIVDGCKGILEYGDGFICLSLGSMSVKFCGDGLCIRSLKTEQAVISGTFTGISFGG